MHAIRVLMNGRPQPESLRRSTWWLVGLLLLLAAWRIGAVVLHEPLLGVANNFDMVRVQACIGAYPTRPPGIDPATNSPEAPLPDYHFVDVPQRACFVTSEALFALGALPAMRLWSRFLGTDGSFPLRLVGIAKGGALISLLTLVSMLWMRLDEYGWAITNALVGLLVLADPAVTLYANSFYAEFAAVFFWYAALSGIALALSAKQVSQWQSAWVGVALALAITSKIQHVVLGIFVLGLLALLRPFVEAQLKIRPLLWALLVATLSATSIQAWHMNAAATVSIREANLTNTFLYAVLGESGNPSHTAKVLGLPPGCASAAGKSWFTAGVQQLHPCPEVLLMSRLRLLPLLWRDTGTVWRTLTRTLRESRNWLPALGTVAGDHWAALPAKIPSVGRWTAHLPESVFALLIGLPGLFAVALLPARRLSPASRFMLLATTTFPWLSLVIVTYGDGLADAAKQSHLATASGLAGLLACIAVAGACIAQRACVPGGISRAPLVS